MDILRYRFCMTGIRVVKRRCVYSETSTVGFPIKNPQQKISVGPKTMYDACDFGDITIRMSQTKWLQLLKVFCRVKNRNLQILNRISLCVVSRTTTTHRVGMGIQCIQSNTSNPILGGIEETRIRIFTSGNLLEVDSHS